MNSFLRLSLWYILGSAIWLFLTCLMPAPADSIHILYLSFLSLTIGLTIGALGKEYFCRKPWLLLFVPLFHIFIFMI